MSTSLRTTPRNRASTAGPEYAGPEYVDPGPTEPEPTEPEPTEPAPPPEPSEDSDESEEQHWNDEGDSWWAPHPVPPSYRDPT